MENNIVPKDTKTILKDAFEHSLKVEFICHFKGIPFVHEATIDKLTRHYIVFNTFPSQMIAIKETGHVYIVHPKYKERIIEAKFLEMKKGEDGAVSLYDFELYTGDRISRKKLRIVPDEATFNLKVIDEMVKMYYPRVIDVSDDSVSLSFNELPHSIHMDCIFYVKITFTNPKGLKKTEITLKCKPLRIGEVGGKARVVGTFVDIKDTKKELLDLYLQSEQLRIVNEFKLIKNIELGKVS